MLKSACWIGYGEEIGEVCPIFSREFGVHKEVKKALLHVTAIGVYEASMNGVRIGEFILAPGCTAYKARLQYQTYEVTELLSEQNELEVMVGTGWYRGHISKKSPEINSTPCGVLAALVLQYADGSEEMLVTDSAWTVRTSNILFSDIYDGEFCDGTVGKGEKQPVKLLNLTKETLIPQEGEIIAEHERIKPVKMLVSPKGERILDFGQNLAGYLEITLNEEAGTRIEISHAEILDAEGNFYTENYRDAKAKLEYVCADGKQTYKPHFTFFGFRYIRLDQFPENVDLNQFTAIVLYSDMTRTGKIETGNDKVNQLFSNTVWSQRGNFIDIPTDCPQRDERMGWTGDAQVFAKTACYNYDTRRFFRKWLGDVRAEQLENGGITDIVPNFWQMQKSSTAWGDVITVMPWQMYLMYGCKEVLEENFDSMKKWVDYMTKDTLEQYLWTCEEEQKQLWKKHYGDWLALDAPSGSYKGSSNDDIVASAFYAYSTSLLVKTGKVLGKDVTEYEQLYAKIVETYKKRFPKPVTQTEHVLALHFNLTDDREAVAANLVKMIRENGNRLKTGFVGTPYLLYALSDNGYASVAYDLLLQENYPSWLYEVNHGATTIWEHWDGIRDDGKLWSRDMNSYNHYAYGSVMDWIYSVAAGIQPLEEQPGFRRVKVAPLPNERIGWLNVSYDSVCGKVQSSWKYHGDCVRYEITVPVEATIIIDGMEHDVKAGSYVYYGKK